MNIKTIDKTQIIKRKFKGSLIKQKIKIDEEKLTKTQKKVKRRRTQKVGIDSPTRLLSSDSEFDEMSPNQYLEYVDILSRFKSDQSEQRQQIPLQMQLEEDKYQESPSKVDQLDSDGLRDINHGTQHGWLASQHETDNDSPLPTKEYKRNSFENKNHENIQDEKDLNESHLVKESDTHTEVTPYAFKRDYGSDNRRVIDEISSKDHSKIHETNSEDNSKIQEKVVSKPNKKINSNKPFYKSIIATTAAIIIQRFWRNYRSQKLNQGQHDGGTSILEVLKQKIQSNQPFICKFKF